MTRIDQITADILAGSPETHIAILAREVVRLREARAVVAQDDDRPSREFLENYVEGFDPGERSAALFGWREGRRHLRENSRAIPSDRVLGKGMVGVDRKALERLRRIETCARDFQERQRNLTISQDSYGFFQADNALESALRANQGGADHD